MQWLIVQESWADYQTPIQQQWDKLTNQQLNAIDGQEALLIQTLQSLYAITHFQAKLQVSQWLYSQTPQYTQRILVFTYSEQVVP